MVGDVETKMILSIISFLTGAIVWSLKGWLSERLTKRRAGDQLVSLGELDLYCRRKHDDEKVFREVEIKHLRELLEKDLSFNSARLKSLEDSVSILTEVLAGVNKNIAVLVDTKHKA